MKNQELSKRRQAIYIACYLGLYPGFIFWHFLSLKISGALRAELQATLSESALRNWDVFTFVLYAVALALLISRSRISIALGSDWKTILLRVALMALTVWGIQYYFDSALLRVRKGFNRFLHLFQFKRMGNHIFNIIFSLSVQI